MSMIFQLKKERIRRESPKNISRETNGVWEVREALEEVKFTAKGWTGATSRERLSRLRLFICVDEGPEEGNFQIQGGKKVRNEEREYSALKLESWQSHCQAESGTSDAVTSICYINHWLNEFELNNEELSEDTNDWHFFLLLIPLTFSFHWRHHLCLTAGFLSLALLSHLRMCLPQSSSLVLYLCFPLPKTISILHTSVVFSMPLVSKPRNPVLSWALTVYLYFHLVSSQTPSVLHLTDFSLLPLFMTALDGGLLPVFPSWSMASSLPRPARPDAAPCCPFYLICQVLLNLHSKYT